MSEEYEVFNKLLRYDPETGKLYWRKRRGGRAISGSEAGAVNPRGYIQVGVNWRRYYAHRVAWLLTYEDWPQEEIDHINGIRTDNRISNLRVVTSRGNHHNLPCHRNGRLVGAHFNKQTGRWASRIRIDGKQSHLGYFDTEQEAHETYIGALEEI